MLWPWRGFVLRYGVERLLVDRIENARNKVLHSAALSILGVRPQLCQLAMYLVVEPTQVNEATMRSVSGTHTARWTIAVVALLLFAYTTVRATTICFSWDEAYSFMHFVRNNVFFLNEYDVGGANHHLLNVWGMWACAKLFGTGEFAQRIPNLLCHLLFLYGSARIAFAATRPLLMVPVFLLFNLHPYLLDFFSLARGYGIANGFMMVALWELFRFSTEDGQPRYALRAVVFASIAALAHTMMLNFLLGVITAIVGMWLVRSRKEDLGRLVKPCLAMFVIAGLCFSVVVPNAVGMYHGGSLFFGSDSFWQGMMGSLAEKFCYHFLAPLEPLTTMSWILVVIGTLVSIVLFAARSKGWNSAPLVLGLVVAVVVLLALFAQRVLLHLPWPSARTALFVVPLLAYLLAVALISWRGSVWVPLVFALPLTALLLMHMSRSANTRFVVEWRPSGQFHELLAMVENDRLPLTPHRPTVTVGIGGQCSPSFGYYNYMRGLQWLVNIAPPAQDSFPRCDYYVVEWDAEKWVDHRNWTLVYRSEETGTSLFRDERLRRPANELLVCAEQDMERQSMVGTTNLDHVSGQRCVRFDRWVRGTDTLEYTVPAGWNADSMLIIGTAMVKQQDESNWMSLVLQHQRNGVTLDEAVAGSAPQTVRFGTWTKVAVQYRPRVELREGDRLLFLVAPYGSLPPMLVDDMEMSITR